MSSLSASSLFHFTSSLENLLDILTNEFKPHYSVEDFSLIRASWTSEPYIRCIPMVSFCDIPLAQTVAHMKTYGEYAIGLNKSWAMKKGISPVVYAYPNSTSSIALAGLLYLDLKSPLAGVKGAEAGIETIETNLIDHGLRLMAFVKPYQGPFKRHGHADKEVRFYDEREWRFIPTALPELPRIDPPDFVDASKRNAVHAYLHGRIRLSFDPADIRYIIVSREAEILPIAYAIETIKAKYSVDERLLLTTRVISAEHIRDDF